MDPLLIISFVMLISGFVGGIVNFFLADPDNERPLTWWKHALVGIAAAFMVPLVLNMISGDLIEKIRGTPPGAGDYSKLFVLAGFCLVAAVSSRAFIRSLSEKLLQQVKSANQKAEHAQEQAADAKAAVAPLIEDDAQDDPSAITSAEVESSATSKELSTEEDKVMKSMLTSSFSLRSITGIAKETELPKPIVNGLLSSLIVKGLVAQTTSSTGQPRWYATHEARLQQPKFESTQKSG